MDVDPRRSLIWIKFCCGTRRANDRSQALEIPSVRQRT